MLRLSRSELYELVWENPLNRIAAAYRVDAIGLAKTCDEYDVPRPPPGYWQKLEYGKPVQQPPLDSGDFAFDEVVIVSERRSTKELYRIRHYSTG